MCTSSHWVFVRLALAIGVTFFFFKSLNLFLYIVLVTAEFALCVLQAGLL